MTPITKRLINQEDLNSDLDEQTTDHLFLKVLPAGALVSSCYASCKWMHSA